MARSGIPVAELLLAQRRHAPPSPWVMLDYGIAIFALLTMTGVAIYLGCWVLDLFSLYQSGPGPI